MLFFGFSFVFVYSTRRLCRSNEKGLSAKREKKRRATTTLTTTASITNLLHLLALAKWRNKKQNVTTTGMCVCRNVDGNAFALVRSSFAFALCVPMEFSLWFCSTHAESSFSTWYHGAKRKEIFVCRWLWFGNNRKRNSTNWICVDAWPSHFESFFMRALLTYRYNACVVSVAPKFFFFFRMTRQTIGHRMFVSPVSRRHSKLPVTNEWWTQSEHTEEIFVHTKTEDLCHGEMSPFRTTSPFFFLWHFSLSVALSLVPFVVRLFWCFIFGCVLWMMWMAFNGLGQMAPKNRMNRKRTHGEKSRRCRTPSCDHWANINFFFF